MKKKILCVLGYLITCILGALYVQKFYPETSLWAAFFGGMVFGVVWSLIYLVWRNGNE